LFSSLIHNYRPKSPATPTAPAKVIHPTPAILSAPLEGLAEALVAEPVAEPVGLLPELEAVVVLEPELPALTGPRVPPTSPGGFLVSVALSFCAAAANWARVLELSVGTLTAPTIPFSQCPGYPQ